MPRRSRSEYNRRGTQHPKRHYGRATTCRSIPPAALRATTIELLSSSLSSCWMPVIVVTFSNGTPPVSVSTGARNRRRRGEGVRRNLHHAAAVVRRQQEFLAALAVDDHVEHAIACAELGDRHAAHFLPWLQVADRELHERRAGVAGEQVLLSVERVGHERVDGRPRLHRPMVAVVNLDARAAVDVRERIRNRAKLRRELFIRQAGHPETAIRKRHVGDDLRAWIGARRGIRRGRVLDLDALELQGLQRHVGNRSRAVDAEQRRSGARALAAHHRHVGIARLRMHGEIGNDDFARTGAQERGELLIDRVEALRAGRAAAGLRAKVERHDRRALRIGREQGAVGSKGERADRAERRAFARARDLHGRRGRQRRKDDEGQHKPSLRAKNFIAAAPFERWDNATPADDGASRRRMTTLPKCAPLARCSYAARVSSNENTRSMTGSTLDCSSTRTSRSNIATDPT